MYYKSYYKSNMDYTRFVNHCFTFITFNFSLFSFFLNLIKESISKKKREQGRLVTGKYILNNKFFSNERYGYNLLMKLFRGLIGISLSLCMHF